MSWSKRCKHPKNEVGYVWLTKHGTLRNFHAGCGELHKQFICLQCGKVVKDPDKRWEERKENEQP